MRPQMLQIERQILTYQFIIIFSEKYKETPRFLMFIMINIPVSFKTSFEIMIWGRFVQEGIVM